MKPYWRFVLPAGLGLVVIVFLLFQLSSNLVFFNTPTELLESPPATDTRLRLGGQVARGTLASIEGGVSFTVTDGRQAVPVHHKGAPQQLFQEGRGVVLEGTYDGTLFHSDSMLVKHDEQYRTEDVEDGDYDPGSALKSQAMSRVGG